jgi:hypothetical protein
VPARIEESSSSCLRRRHERTAWFVLVPWLVVEPWFVLVPRLQLVARLVVVALTRAHR